MQDVTVIGPAVVDVLAAPFSKEALAQGSCDLDRIRLSFGGDALNEAVVLTRLGKGVQLISKVGADQAGALVLAYLEKKGVSTESVQVEEGLDTAVNLALIEADGSRRFLMNPHSSLRRLGPEDVFSRVGGMASIVSFASMFISPLFTMEAMEALFARIRQSGRTLVVDMTRPKQGETLADIRPLLPYMDVFVPNDEEIASLTGIADPAGNVRTLVQAGVGCAVVKTGREGCLVGWKGTAADIHIVHVPAVPDVRCIDTTGAGDTFAGGLIAGLCDGLALPDAARLGCAAASCSVEQIGATDGVRSLEQVMERYRRIGT